MGDVVHFPFLVADTVSGVHTRLTAQRLAEVSLAPAAAGWNIAPIITQANEAIWADSLANAPAETCAAIAAALHELVLATPDLRPPVLDRLDDSRAKQRMEALLRLWASAQDALPEGLAAVRHILSLPHGRCLTDLTVVEGSLDPHAPALMQALYARLRDEFGSVPDKSVVVRAADPSLLHAVQAGLATPNMPKMPRDDSLSFYGLRDRAACADFAAAQARAWIDAGVQPRDIAVLVAGDTYHLQRACAAQGISLSGLAQTPDRRDVIGEAALNLLLAKRSPTPPMVLAALALSPLMPWTRVIGRAMAEAMMAGNFRALGVELDAEQADLWNDIRRSVSNVQELRLSCEHICKKLAEGDTLRGRLSVAFEGDALDWERILRSVSIAAPVASDAVRNVEGVSLWSALEHPWRPCDYLIVSDFTEGHYPSRPSPNPMFLDSEIEALNEATSLRLRGRSQGLEQSLALFDTQLQNCQQRAVFLVPWRGFGGERLAPSVGLSLLARAYADDEDAKHLIQDISKLEPQHWPVDHHCILPNHQPLELPEMLEFKGVNLLGLRVNDDGEAKPQSPSRLETLLVSPLAWLLSEMGAEDQSWGAESLDVMMKGNIAHHVFEHIFPAGDIGNADSIRAALPEAYDEAVSLYAGFLKSAVWDMERNGLEQDILAAALRWREHLEQMEAKIVGNEMWLAGEAHGVRMHGKADMILELPDGDLLIIDHKKSGTKGRRSRMEKGWDLQAGLYRDMLKRPIRREGDGLDLLIGRGASIAYHLMNDGGVLSSGRDWGTGVGVRDMGTEVDSGAVAKLNERLAELKNGRIMLNSSEDQKYFTKEGGFTPYALTDGPLLVRSFIRDIEGGDE